MARPQKQTVDYFPHFSNASEGMTLTVLQDRYGNNGYAFWFKLLEKLASTDGHYLKCRNDVETRFLHLKTRIEPKLALEMLNLLAELGSIDQELWTKNRIIWSQNLVDNVAEVYRNRRRTLPLKPVSTPDNAVSTPDNAVSTPDNAVSTCNLHLQSKVKESKVNKSKVNIPPQKKQSFDDFLNSLRTDYPGLNVDKEWEACQTWWSEGKKQMSRPKTALRNWLNIAQERKNNFTKGGNNGRSEKYRGLPGNRPSGAFADIKDDGS